MCIWLSSVTVCTGLGTAPFLPNMKIGGEVDSPLPPFVIGGEVDGLSSWMLLGGVKMELVSCWKTRGRGEGSFLYFV